MACEFTKTHTAGGPGQLDHWEKIELKRIMESQAGMIAWRRIEGVEKSTSGRKNVLVLSCVGDDYLSPPL